ncbi:NUDIX hydrolase [Listeria sp. PSOL-1]|uniref:NUDIX domain-containing protein n=1 Tax=Listeria sp. PSOL-1 TaxID=1844999 RepID=UPI0013D3A559|nr:NUDIX hydrolase [Listeria sp. PSOL-1]
MVNKFVKKEDALKHYDAEKFRTPDGYTSDILLFTIKKQAEVPKLHVLLIERSKENAEGKPNIEGGKWAIPGGFVNPDEDAYTAGVRELKEETGLSDIALTAFGVFDKPGRDPRGWIISRAHYAFAPLESLGERLASDDAAKVELFSVEDALNLSLAFDHKEILLAAFQTVTKEMLLSTKVSCFLPEYFTEQELYHALAGCTVKEALPPFEDFTQYLLLLPFLERCENNKYHFSSEANAHSIFF